MSTTVIELENKDIVVKMSGQGPIGPRGQQGEPGPAGPSEWGVIQGNISDQTDLQNALNAKANVGDSYTKAEDDALLAQKADADSVYTKTETDSLLADKADSDTVYTKTETDTLLGAKADVGDSYTKTEEDTLLNAKANSADVYTKTETDTLLANKADADDVYTKTEVDDALADKADSADVYTKTATDALLLDKAPVILNSASGSIASFTDGSPAPVTALSVGIEPAQDLHGYDNPWPAGGGKNLLKPPTSGATIKGITFTVNSDGTITANGGTSTGDADFYFVGAQGVYESANVPTGNYIVSGNSGAANVTTIHIVKKTGSEVICTQNANIPVSVSLDENEQYRIFIRVHNGKTVTNQKYYPMIRLASVTDATFAPYSNICPISGWDEAVVTRVGKNLFDANLHDISAGVTYEVLEDGSLKVTSGSYTTSTKWELTGLLAKGTYTIKNYSGLSLYIQSSSSDYTNSVSVGNSKTFVYDGKSYLRILSTNQSANTTVIHKIQIELGSTATSYEPYQGTSVTIDLDGTCYGGVLDVLTGEMTVDRVIFERNSSTMNNSESYPGWKSSGLKQYYGNGVNTTIYGAISNIFGLVDSGHKYCSFNSTNDTVYLAKALFSNKTQTEWIAEAVDVQIVCPLVIGSGIDARFTVTLSPSQMSTLLGTNHIFADTGDVAVEYRADTKLFVQEQIAESETLTRKMIADIANGDLAPKTLAVGDLVIVGDELRKATANIGQGSAITSLNSTTANLADVIKALQ